MTDYLKSQEDLIKDFQILKNQRKSLSLKIKTKEEIANQEKNEVKSQTAASYTTEIIVKGMVDLQLNFGKTTEELADQLKSELEKLDLLKIAIALENKKLKEIKDTQMAADALHILKQEQESRIKKLEEEKIKFSKDLEDEIKIKKNEWAKELKVYEQMMAEKHEQLSKKREKELADYLYDLEKKHKIEANQFEENKKQSDRKLLETEDTKSKDWIERERKLQEQQPRLAEYKKKVDGFEEELSKTIEKSRQEAIKTANEDAKIRLDLFEKDIEGQQKIYESQLLSSEENINQNTARIEQLGLELKEALQQVQNLSMKALENSSNKSIR